MRIARRAHSSAPAAGARAPRAAGARSTRCRRGRRCRASGAGRGRRSRSRRSATASTPRGAEQAVGEPAVQQAALERPARRARRHCPRPSAGHTARHRRATPVSRRLERVAQHGPVVAALGQRAAPRPERSRAPRPRAPARRRPRTPRAVGDEQVAAVLRVDPLDADRVEITGRPLARPSSTLSSCRRPSSSGTSTAVARAKQGAISVDLAGQRRPRARRAGARPPAGCGRRPAAAPPGAARRRAATPRAAASAGPRRWGRSPASRCRASVGGPAGGTGGASAAVSTPLGTTSQRVSCTVAQHRAARSSDIAIRRS